MSAVRIWVPGTPTTQGSTRAFVNHTTGRVVVRHDNAKTAPWRDQIAMVVHQELDGRFAPAGVSVNVHLAFVLPRPASHWRRDGTPRKSAAEFPRLDIDKLARAVLDALTGVAWTDDSQVDLLLAMKRYQHDPDESTGVRIGLTARWAQPEPPRSTTHA